MFSLILTILGIVILVAITLAMFYYGGSISDTAKKEAEVARAVNELGQFHAAIVSYRVNEGLDPESSTDLVTTKHLAHLPNGWGETPPASIVFESRQFVYGGESDNQTACIEVNNRLNFMAKDAVPPACNALPDGFFGCCESN